MLHLEVASHLSALGIGPAHTATVRDSPLIGSNSSQTVEERVRVVLGLDAAKSIVILAVEGPLPVRLVEVALGKSVFKSNRKLMGLAYLVQVST